MTLITVIWAPHPHFSFSLYNYATPSESLIFHENQLLTSKEPFLCGRVCYRHSDQEDASCCQPAEGIAARDVIAQHLSSACRSIQDKSATIENLRQQNKYLEDILKEHFATYTRSLDEHAPPAGRGSTTGCARLTNKDSKVQNNTLKEQLSNSEEPPKYKATEAFSQV